MSGQLSLFTVDLDTPVASEPASEVVIALSRQMMTGDITRIAPETVITECGGIGSARGDIVALVGLHQKNSLPCLQTRFHRKRSGIAPVIADDQPVEETTDRSCADEIDDHIANETVSSLPRPIDLEEEETEPAHGSACSCASDPARKTI